MIRHTRREGRWTRWGIPILALLLLVFGRHLSAESAAASDSTNYAIDHLILSSGAAHTSSGQFEAWITFGQTGPSGSASRCNSGFMTGLGFWSVLGESPVENVLSVTIDRTGRIDLNWSGSVSRFDVYRSTSAETVLDPANLLVTTTDCVVVDDTAPEAEIVFYNILPAGD